MYEWTPMEVEDSLQLLSAEFQHAAVRRLAKLANFGYVSWNEQIYLRDFDRELNCALHLLSKQNKHKFRYAVSRLSQAPSGHLQLYLLQLVQVGNMPDFIIWCDFFNRIRIQLCVCVFLILPICANLKAIMVWSWRRTVSDTPLQKVNTSSSSLQLSGAKIWEPDWHHVWLGWFVCALVHGQRPSRHVNYGLQLQSDTFFFICYSTFWQYAFCRLMSGQYYGKKFHKIKIIEKRFFRWEWDD